MSFLCIAEAQFQPSLTRRIPSSENEEGSERNMFTQDNAENRQI